MSSVTQKIPSYVLGMSTQPDEKKLPGQVVNLVNGVPDVVRQLIKRPGSHLINTITPSTAAHSKWFHIYTTDALQYIGQVANDGVVKIWRCSDGVEIPVDYADVAGTNKATYLDNSALDDEKSSDIQVNTINETTFFVNRRKDTAILQADKDKSPAQLNEAFVSLDTISYGKQYALDIYSPADNTEFTHTRATSIVVDEVVKLNGTSSDGANLGNGDCTGMGREYVTVSSERGIGSTSPPLTTALTGTYSRTGTTVTASITNHGYSVGESVTLDFTSGAAADGIFEILTTADANTFTVTHGDSGSTSGNCTIPRGRTNLRYEIDTRCTPQPTDDSDADNYHDAYNSYVKLQFGGEGWQTDDTHTHTSSKGLTTTITVKEHVTITSRANIAMVRPAPTSSNSEEHVSAAGIVGDIKATLDAISGTGVTCKVVGNGIYLYSATAFGVTSPEKQLMTVTTTEANNIADLPRVCRHGYTVRIVNSGEDMDDYYLRFQAEGLAADTVQQATYTRSGSTVTVTTASAHGLANGSDVILDFTSGAATDGFYTITATPSSTTFTVTDSASGTIDANPDDTVTIHPARFGEGVWEEVAAPGITTTLDNDTMPLQLTRATPGTYDTINGGGGTTAYANGFFRFAYPTWGKRDVGDDITNPEPTFVGNPIQRMFFFRNRIGLLSKENVILSRVNEYENFWVKTAMAISNADPIDLQSSSVYPTKLYDAVETNTGLIIFSASEQFLLSSGAEALLTPETAKITYLASYAFNPDTSAVSLGTTVGFLNSTARDARFYELANASTREPPTIMEQSKIIGKIFPQTLTLISASTENDLLLFATDSTLHTSTNEVWGYKWFEAGDRRAQSAWFRWTMPNNVVFHTILDDKYYVVLNTGSTYTLERFDIKFDPDTLAIGTYPDENRVHLDTKKKIVTGNITYDSQEDISTFTLPSGYYSNKTLTAYCTTDSDAAGKSYDIPTIHLDKTFAASAVDTSAETITIASHTLLTGNPVTYQEGSSAVAGLTDNTVYYVIKVDDNTVKLATTRANAIAGTAINLTSQGGGTHTLEVPTVTLPGNWKTSTKDGASVNTDLIVGYEYEFEVELPKLYITRQEGEKVRSETRGSLVIHRMNFDFGDVGVIDVTLKRRGRDDYTYTVESLEWDNVLASRATIADSYTHTIPVYDRNENLTVFLKSNHPSPATIHSMNWEGDYSPRYYQRV